MKRTILVLLAVAAIDGAVIAEPDRNAEHLLPLDTQLGNRGTVLEVINSPAYTYLQVSGGTGTIWLAAYRNEVAKGDTIRYSHGVMMTNFRSNALNRTFDKIIFVDAVVPLKK
jgi:hypothetical protein